MLLELLVLAITATSSDLLVTGQVESRNSQYIVTPPSNNFRAQISYMADEGSKVVPGEVVVRFDGTEVESQLRSAKDTLDQVRSTGERDITQIRIEIADAEANFARADVEAEVARTSAEVPAQFIGELEYSENQLALERAVHARDQAAKALGDARSKLEERQRTLDLDLARNLEKIKRWESMLESFEIAATQSGFVLYDSHPWLRNKFSTGDTVQTGWTVATVADDSALEVVAWVNEVDAPHIAAPVEVDVTFDAAPDTTVKGTVVEISPAPEDKPDWGDASYHRTRVQLQESASSLLPGMSALIEIPVSP